MRHITKVYNICIYIIFYFFFFFVRRVVIYVTLTGDVLDTKNRRKLYDLVKEKDEKNQQIITKQYVRIAVLSETISKFREKMATHKAKIKDYFNEITNELNFFYNSYWIMKNRFITGKYSCSSVNDTKQFFYSFIKRDVVLALRIAFVITRYRQ